MPQLSAHPGVSSPTNPRAAITGLGLVTPLGRSLWSTTKALLDGATTTDILDKAQRDINEYNASRTPGMRPGESQDPASSGAGLHPAFPPLPVGGEVDPGTPGSGAGSSPIHGGAGVPPVCASVPSSSALPPHPALALTQDPALITQTVGAIGRVAPWIEDPAIELADLAARQALLDASNNTAAEPLSDIRTIVASSKGAILSLIDDRYITSRNDAATLGPHEWLAHRLRTRLNLGHTTSVVAACATSACALHQARQEIESGEHDRILVVAVEAALHPIFAHTYKRLGVLAPINPLQAHRPRPLDNNRAGFTLVEIAAAVLLEREPAARARGKRIHATIIGSATGTEPHDIVRPAPVFRALASCIKRAVPRDTPLTLIQPHATGTRDNDPRELRAIIDALPNINTTPIYASKGALGHPLGASALVNLTLACAFAQARKRPPMPWLNDPMETELTLTPESQVIIPGAQLITSAGFGGHVAAICFETSPSPRPG